jgi:hypothetical protein
MDNAMEILKAHIAEYGPGLSDKWFHFMLDVYAHIQDASILERLSRA